MRWATKKKSDGCFAVNRNVSKNGFVKISKRLVVFFLWLLVDLWDLLTYIRQVWKTTPVDGSIVRGPIYKQKLAELT